MAARWRVSFVARHAIKRYFSSDRDPVRGVMPTIFVLYGKRECPPCPRTQHKLRPSWRAKVASASRRRGFKLGPEESLVLMVRCS